MKTIWKIELKKGTYISETQLPKGAKCLCVKNQYDVLVLYIEVSTKAELEKRIFMVVETGKEIPITDEKSKYIGSALFLSDSYVSHVYEII